MEKAKMLVGIQLLGTSLRLQKDDIVMVERAYNQPDNESKYFARPFSDQWSDGINHHENDSIMICRDDFEWI